MSQRGPGGPWDIAARKGRAARPGVALPPGMAPLVPISGSGAPMVPSASIPAPEVYPWPESIDFAADAFTGALTNVNTPAILAAFQVPVGRVGVVRDISTLVQNLLPTSNIRFAVRVNGGPVPGWDFPIFPRTATSVGQSFAPESTLVRLTDGALVELQVRVIDGGTYSIGGSFHGWHWSKNTDNTFRLSWPGG